MFSLHQTGLHSLSMLNERIGHYRVLRLLGEGGMGVVYEAVRDDIGVRAAVKVLRPEFARNSDIATRFFNEARAANMVQHAGIVRIFDYGHLPTGEAYLAMEYLEGESLRGRLDREGRLNEAESMRLGRQIASALASAHSKQIVHRDLKPENIMLIADPETPGGERAKVLDFGIAKLDYGASGSVRTRTNTVMGTPIYMAPEQCRGIKTIDDKADVYALGVMIFEMQAGRPPFHAEAPGDVIGMHMFQQPPPLSAHVPDCDPTLNLLIAKMLAKDPQRRPSMSEVGQTLKALCNLVSDVMPIRLVPDGDAQGIGAGSSDTVSPAPQRAPAPMPSLAAPMASAGRSIFRQPTDATDKTEPQRRSSESSLLLSAATAVPETKAPAFDAESSSKPSLRLPPTVPMQQISLMPSTAAEARPATERMEPIKARKNPESSPHPNQKEDDRTELLSAAKIGGALQAHPQGILKDADKTAPLMQRRQVQLQLKDYPGAHEFERPPWQQPVVKADERRAAPSRHPRDGWQAALSRSIDHPEKSPGLFIFAGLVLVGLLLGAIILLAS